MSDLAKPPDDPFAVCHLPPDRPASKDALATLARTLAEHHVDPRQQAHVMQVFGGVPHAGEVKRVLGMPRVAACVAGLRVSFRGWTWDSFYLRFEGAGAQWAMEPYATHAGPKLMPALGDLDTWASRWHVRARAGDVGRALREIVSIARLLPRPYARPPIPGDPMRRSDLDRAIDLADIQAGIERPPKPTWDDAPPPGRALLMPAIDRTGEIIRSAKEQRQAKLRAALMESPLLMREVMEVTQQTNRTTAYADLRAIGARRGNGTGGARGSIPWVLPRRG